MFPFIRRCSSHTVFLLVSLLCAPLVNALSYKEVSFEGSLRAVPVPPGWVSEYQPLGDVVVVGDGSTQGFLLSIGPNEEPEAYLSAVVREMDAAFLVKKIRKVKIGGHEAAIIDHFGIVHEKYVAIKKPGALLIIYGTTKHTPESLQQHLEILAEKTELFPITHPKQLSGSYYVDQVEDPGYEPTLVPGLFQEKVTLNSNGAFGDLGFGGQRENVANAFQNSGYLLGSWVQRGNRLIIEEKNSQFVNYRIQATSSGLTLVDQDGVRTSWVKH